MYKIESLPLALIIASQELKSLHAKWDLDFGTEMAIFESCTSALLQVLAGTKDPLDILFARDSNSNSTALYKDTPLALYLGSVFGNGVSKALDCAPEGRSIRILEIGAGTGGTTQYVLAALPHAHRIEYWFTDIHHYIKSLRIVNFKIY